MRALAEPVHEIGWSLCGGFQLIELPFVQIRKPLNL